MLHVIEGESSLPHDFMAYVFDGPSSMRSEAPFS